MKIIFFLWCIFISILLNAQTTEHTFIHESLTRNYRLHLPSGYVPNQMYPLVFSFHGYTSNAFQQEIYTGMSNLADDENFIVVYPDGINNAWNVGFGLMSYFSGVNDVGFVNALLDTLFSNYSIDTDRVYACGMSNGGYFSYRLACELSDRFAAIASVTGLITDSTAANCNPSRHVPALQIHGTADPVVNYNGMTGSLGVEESLNYWMQKNECTGETYSTALPNSNVADLSTAEHIIYTGCDGCSSIEFYKITNGGHTWPDGIIDVPNFGTTNRDLNASEAIWTFFTQHSMNCSVGMNSYNEQHVSVYPNPFTDQIQVKINSNESESVICTIYDINGKKIYCQLGTANMNFSFLPTGIYTLQIMLDDDVVTKKIIKTAD